VIDFNIQICNVAKINALMNKIDQGQKLNKHITLETTLVIIVHAIHLSFINFDRSIVKSQTNTSCNEANLIKE
jgi:hypothetical protein